MASVTYDHVTKQFADGTFAVRDLCLDIKDGEFMVLVGPSGCGKSTALRLLAGLDEVSEGRLMIGDQVVNEVPTRNREVAMVFQSYALYPHMSVFDNMAFGLRMQGMAIEDIGRRVYNAAKTLGLGSMLRRKPRELSGGEQQRVALGRAMVREPQVVLLDEPLSSLDARLRVQMRVELHRLHRTLRATFIYVTHDQVEAMTMGDRIAVLKDGEVQQVGSPRQVYDRPANVFVAGFIGSPSMNLIPVTVDRRTALASGFQVELPLAPRVERGTLGIRPDAMTDRVAENQPCIDVCIELFEIVGPDQFVHASVGTDSIIARVDPRLKVRRGDRMRLAVDQQRLHFFEAGTGRAIV